MRKFMLLGLFLATTAAYAQSVPSNKAGNILDNSPLAANVLPAPQTSADTVTGLLDAAKAALTAGRTGEAQEALEEAETRALDRSVPVGDAHNAITSPLITDIYQARQALGNKDIAGAQHAIDLAHDAASHD